MNDRITLVDRNTMGEPIRLLTNQQSRLVEELLDIDGTTWALVRLVATSDGEVHLHRLDNG